MVPSRRLIDDFPDPQPASPAEQLQHRLAAATRLLDATRQLAAEVVAARIAETVVQVAQTALGCERALLFLFLPERKELVAAVRTELESGELRCALGAGIAGCVAQQRRIISVREPAGDARWLPDYDQRFAFQTRNLLAAPLLAEDGRLLGVLQVMNRAGEGCDECDEDLLATLARHVVVALDRAQVVEQIHRQQALRASLQVAREIQRGFMPQKLPRIERYEAASWWFPNEAVGGDYCDLIPLKDGRHALVIADVSGHGLGPSLLMASVRAALHALVLEHTAPEVLLNLLDRSLRGSLTDGRFITMVLAVLDPKDNSLEYANAGHAPALHYEAATGEFFALEPTGMPLGVLDRPEYPQGWPIEMEVGDLIVLGTDGIVEAMDSDQRQFGLHRLEQLVREAARRPVEEIMHLVGSQVEAHYQGEHPPDDLTLLAIRRNR